MWFLFIFFFHGHIFILKIYDVSLYITKILKLYVLDRCSNCPIDYGRYRSLTNQTHTHIYIYIWYMCMHMKMYSINGVLFGIFLLVFVIFLFFVDFIKLWKIKAITNPNNWSEGKYKHRLFSLYACVT